MAWETRERGGRYYTRSVREGGRVRREYIGTGATAALIAAHDERAREARMLIRAAERTERDGVERAAAEFTEFDTLIESVARLALIAAGYQRHHRGEWRKRREQAEADQHRAGAG